MSELSYEDKEKLEISSYVGCAGMAIVIVALIIASVAVGFTFGVQWGLLCASGVIMLYGVTLWLAARKENRRIKAKQEEESDGR